VIPPDDRDEFGILAALRRAEEDLILHRLWDPEDSALMEYLEGRCATQRRAREIEHTWRALSRAEGDDT
jgi:hypothetical protein